MSTTVEQLRGWFTQGVAQGATHLVVVCDTFEWEDYPVYVAPDQDVYKVHAHYHGPNMQKVMEVYDLRKPMEAQIGSGKLQFNF